MFLLSMTDLDSSFCDWQQLCQAVADPPMGIFWGANFSHGCNFMFPGKGVRMSSPEATYHVDCIQVLPCQLAVMTYAVPA
jgi:hypothetical protein